MDYISWKEEYSVGNEMLDNQHKKIFALINKLYEAFMNKTEKIDGEKIMLELVDYSKTHFGQEEQLFKQYKYAQAEEHIKQHKIFIQTLHDITKNNMGNEKIFSIKITGFLQKWLVDHILQEDKKYKVMFPKK